MQCKNSNNADFSGDFIKFIDFANRRFAFYLDTLEGCKNNLAKMKDLQLRSSVMLNKSIEELDLLSIIQANEPPPTDIASICEKSLNIRTQKQYKIDNGISGINGAFALYDCLSGIYNEWKITKQSSKDFNIPVMAYICKIRNRAQHELHGDKNFIKANSLIKIEKSLSGYQFPQFAQNDDIVLTQNDCFALIKEIRLQLHMGLI